MLALLTGFSAAPCVAQTFDAFTAAAYVLNTNTISQSHVPAGTPDFATVCVHGADVARSVSTITYGGAAMTAVPSSRVNSGASFYWTQLWYKVAPAAGTQTVVLTLDTTDSSFVEFTMSIMTYTGVHQTTPLGTAATATGGASPATVNVGSASGELVIDCATMNNGAFTSVGAGQTERERRQASDGGGAASSTEPGAASVTMSWPSDARPWAIACVPLKPAGGAARRRQAVVVSPR